MFSTFLLESKKQSYDTTIKYLDELVFSLTLAFKLIYDDFSLSKITEIIHMLPQLIDENKEIILSNDVINSYIFNKINNNNKNLKISFKVNILNYSSDDLKEDNFNSNGERILSLFLNIKNNCKIYKKLENTLIKAINKSFLKDNLSVIFHLYIDNEYKSLLNINLLSNNNIIKNFQILLRRNEIQINESFFHFIFNFSKHFNLTITENIADEKLPRSYKELQNFVYKYPEHFINENNIVYYIKKYLEEKEKYHLKTYKKYKDKVMKEKNELEICRNLLNALYHFFIQKYSFVFNKSEFHFSNPNLIYFNSLFCNFLRKYLLNKDYYNIFIVKDKIIEIDEKILDALKANDFILYKIQKNEIIFYPFIKNEHIFNDIKIFFDLAFSIKENTSRKFITIYIS